MQLMWYQSQLCCGSRDIKNVGSRFLHQLLATATISSNNNREAYLTLSVTILATLCCVPDIASSEDMNSNIPLMLEVISMSSSSIPSPVLEECCEFLYLVLTASEKGIMKFYEFSGIKILALRLRALQGNEDDPRLVDMCIKLLRLIIRRISLDKIQKDYLFELSIIVVALARQFAILHNSLKFEALHILNSVICSIDLSQLVKTLQDSSWSDDIRVGIVAILQNRVAAAERLQVLILAESMVSIFGEDWLIVGQVSNTDDMSPQDTLANIEAYSLKQRNVAVAYSLVEKIIRLISNVGENGVNLFDKGTLTKLILQLNETIAVVLEYLEDAKEHGQRKGDGLLASVPIIGSYLAEAPLACNEKVRDLLGYMLSIEGADEQMPFQSVCFLLPMLCQITMKVEGCKALASCEGGLKAVLDCLRKLIGSKLCMVEDDSCVFLACDTIMNLLLNKDKLSVPKMKNGNGNSRSPSLPGSKEHSKAIACETSKTSSHGLKHKIEPNLNTQNAPEADKKVKPKGETVQVSQKKTNENTPINEGGKKEKRVLSDADADVLIQAIYRGYLVRKWKPLKKLRQIAEVSKEVTYVRDRSQAFEGSYDLKKDNMQTIAIGLLVRS
ncbi:unnamed protein product [Trifolium pratense]|uniref:Uncharacterized protein n=1 Tax=Trifolium pratense TaxID=57577 RepID=A0ACB0L2H6_TRIPR|nr:unnamed protein product [Trifolium pratense]